MKPLLKFFTIIFIAINFAACTKTYKTAISAFMQQKINENSIKAKSAYEMPTNPIYTENTNYEPIKFTTPEKLLDTNFNISNFANKDFATAKNDFKLVEEQYNTLKKLYTFKIGNIEELEKKIMLQIDSLSNIKNKLMAKINTTTNAYLQQGIFKVQHTFMAQFKNTQQQQYTWVFYYTAKNEIIGYDEYVI